jgi:O-antigen ligase
MVRFFIVTPSRIALIGYGALIGIVFAALLLGEQTNEWGVVSKRQSIKGLNNNFIAYVIVGSFYLYLLINKLKFFPKWMGYLVIPLASFVFVKLLLLGTRGALVGFVALCVWLFIYKIFSRNVIVVSIVIGFLGIMIFTSGYFESSISHLGSYSERDTGDLSGRVPTWAVARGYIYDYYLLGIGIGSFSLVNPNGMGAHNFFLTILLETGFIGFGAFLCFFVSLFLPALVKKPTENNKFVLGAFFVFWFPIAMTGHWELSPFSWLLLGVTFNILRYQQRNYA